jgi:hypothetical protein
MKEQNINKAITIIRLILLSGAGICGIGAICCGISIIQQGDWFGLFVMITGLAVISVAVAADILLIKAWKDQH